MSMQEAYMSPGCKVSTQKSPLKTCTYISAFPHSYKNVNILIEDIYLA